MKIRVLGCAGGIGGAQLRTTSFLVDDDVLIDAGTGAADLSLPELVKINHVFLTHAHMDHICALPMLLDSVAPFRSTSSGAQPVTVYALPQVIDVLQRHIFNNQIWPDFSRIPSASQPYLRYQSLALGETFTLPEQRRFQTLPADHVVPACGYLLTSANGKRWAFSGDTGPCPALWQTLNTLPSLDALIIETAFSNAEEALAIAAKHLCPKQLYAELSQLTLKTPIYITHLKPGEADLTMQEVNQTTAVFAPRALQQGQVFDLSASA